jgi:hypothetical protein
MPNSTHFKNPLVVQPKLTATYDFFASQRSYGYALSQEKPYLARQFYLAVQGGS